MAKKQKLDYERNPWKMVLYIIVVLLLIGSLMYLMYHTRQQKKAYQDQLRELGTQETEYIRPTREQESETETQSVSAEKTIKKSSETSKDETTVSEDNDKIGYESESETEEIQGETTVTLDVSGYLAHVLLLNASGRAGVAGAWRKELEKDGYKNVTIASYTGSAKEQTQIYVRKSRRKLAEHLKELFTNAEMKFDTFTEGFEMSDGDEKPEDVDIYVLIGREDIPNE